jgi:4-hydroxythreonine-4-phosphate dehydrogenase
VTQSALSHNKPLVGITIGDPCGIGPEITLKAIAEKEIHAVCRSLLIADAAELKRQAQLLGLQCDYPIIKDFPPSSCKQDDIIIFDTGNIINTPKWGELSAESGRAAIDFIETGTRLCLSGKIDAITTAPINKEAIRLAGSTFSGHTDMLASLCGVEDYLMAFYANNLCVVLLTVHLSLTDAIKSIDKEMVRRALMLADRELRRFGLDNPKIAVAGLNPHAGENGLFGTEEIKEIGPAIAQCQNILKLDVRGPFPADTVFVRAARGEFDAVLACYHDQGLIAVKCLAFGEAVNVTLGLPIIRTSVDHGTAFDIAGRGVADHSSMVEAIKLAARLAEAEKNQKRESQSNQ